MNTKLKSTGNETCSNTFSCDWSQALEGLAYAYQVPKLSGKLKLSPGDFIVTEMMDVIPCGEGEHYWLDVTKVKVNTEQLAKALGRFANVNARDVGYSGMKDFFAQTRQWFSVWKPKGGVPAWNEFKLDGVKIHQVIKHTRKIKRGTHRSNRFDIVIRDLKTKNQDVVDVDEFNQRLKIVKEQGVPNYFGEQRFGRNADNMSQVSLMFAGQKKIKSRHLRGLLLSSARSWLFNTIVSARVEQGTWQVLKPNEPANLNGTNSVFQSTGNEDDVTRLAANDIHPTAPMWGEGESKVMQECNELSEWEIAELAPFTALQIGLEDARLDYQRRSIRSIPQNMTWSFNEAPENQASDSDEPERDQNLLANLHVSFELPRGQFATSVLRELVLV